ncbi:MAG: HEAT repeat domain-containing protein, partial [Candidatus Eremiobacterota bacterium]
KPGKVSENITIKHEIKRFSGKIIKKVQEIPVEYETDNTSESVKKDDISLKQERKHIPGQSQKDIKENSIYERGLFQNSQKESWFTNLNFAGEDYDPHKHEEIDEKSSSDTIEIKTDNEVFDEKSSSDTIEIKTGNEVFDEKSSSDTIEIKTGNIEQINTYFQNILQAIESPGEEKIRDTTEEEKKQEEMLSNIFEETLNEEEIDLSEIDEILSSAEGFIEGDFDLSEIDALLENSEKEKLHSELEDFILSDNLLSEKEVNKIDEKEEFISRFDNATVAEKKEILEHIGKIQDSNVTAYIGNIVLHEAHKEVRIKAAEILVERKDENGLDYLMTGIKNETDSDVRKCIALAYSKLKYKK